MKRYTKPLLNTRTSSHTRDFVDSKRSGKAAKRGTAGGFAYAGSTKPQVITSISEELLDNFLENSYKEWERWLNDFELRQSQRKFYTHYTPTDFSNLLP